MTMTRRTRLIITTLAVVFIVILLRSILLGGLPRLTKLAFVLWFGFALLMAAAEFAQVDRKWEPLARRIGWIVAVVGGVLWFLGAIHG
jgi:hypothetical protein